jgi:hypothetical protein
VNPEPIDIAAPVTVSSQSTPLAQESSSPLAPSSSSASSRPPISVSSQIPSTLADETPADNRPSSTPLIALTRLYPDSGPRSGRKEILALGSGFRAEHKLLISFGDQSRTTEADFVNQNNLKCRLPPSDTAGPVGVTLHSPDTPGSVSQESKPSFTYEDIDHKL